VPGVPGVPKGWCAVLSVALLAGCSSNVSASCDWPTDRGNAFPILDDIRRAEDMAIRFADAQGYRPEWSETREACEAKLFSGLSTARGISIADVATARAELDRRGFDWPVNLPIAGLYILVGCAVTRRIENRFRDERLPALFAIGLVSIVLAVAVVVAGQVWAAFVETIRLSSGHLSYRAFRIPWSHHRLQTFALAVAAVWGLAFVELSRRRDKGTTPGTLGT
jgi:hypothetical protein